MRRYIVVNDVTSVKIFSSHMALVRICVLQKRKDLTFTNFSSTHEWSIILKEHGFAFSSYLSFSQLHSFKELAQDSSLTRSTVVSFAIVLPNCRLEQNDDVDFVDDVTSSSSSNFDDVDDVT